MNRRSLITLLGGAAAWPLAAYGQQAGKLYRIGFLWEGPDVFPDEMEAFRQGLSALGYVEGRNLTIEYRWGKGKPERMLALAKELVRLNHGAELHLRRGGQTSDLNHSHHFHEPRRPARQRSRRKPRESRRQCDRAVADDARDYCQGTGTVQGGCSHALTRRRHLRPGHSVAWPGPEGRRGRGPETGVAHSTSARAQRNRVRKRLFLHRPGTRRWGIGAINPAVHCRSEAARRPHDGTQAALAVRTEP